VTHHFRQLVHAAGLPWCRLHDLGHLAASLQLAAGVDLAIVSKRLGHSTYTITADTYCQLLPGVGRQAAEAAAARMVRRTGLRPAA
jgi:integrase